MDDLTYTLRQLCQRNRDGSHTTQADRIVDSFPKLGHFGTRSR